MRQTKTRGFTLVEVLIVVVIISLLAGLALSSYGNYVRKARRADAKADMLEIAQLLERNRTESNRFHQDAAGNAVTLATIGITQSPQQGRAFYNLGLVSAANTYTISAVPTGSQTDDTLCMTLSLNQAGVRTESGSGTVADCW